MAVLLFEHVLFPSVRELRFIREIKKKAVAHVIQFHIYSNNNDYFFFNEDNV